MSTSKKARDLDELRTWARDMVTLGRREDFKMFLYDTWYGVKRRIVCDNKRNPTGLVCGGVTGFECFIACDRVNSLNFLFEIREVVSTIVKVFDEFIGA